MGDIVSFVGQKGGTGKSTLARAFAVEAARHGGSVVIADLDEAQRTSWDWGERRAANGLQPAIAVERVPRLQVFTRAANLDLLVADAPGWADASTLWLAQGSQLTVLPTGGTVDDLNPTIRLMHELMNKGIADWRVALALCRIHSDAQAEFARGYLKQANYKALKGELRERKSLADLQKYRSRGDGGRGGCFARGNRAGREHRGGARAVAQKRGGGAREGRASSPGSHKGAGRKGGWTMNLKSLPGVGPPPSRGDTHGTLDRRTPGKRRKKSGRTEQLNIRVQPGMEERFSALAERNGLTNGAYLEKLLADDEVRGASLEKGVIPAADARMGRTEELRVWCSPSVKQAVPRLAAERGVLVQELIEDLVAREVERLDPHGGKFGVKIAK
jgi:chromosome partitioning protein